MKVRLKMTALLNNKKEVDRLPFMLFQFNYFWRIAGNRITSRIDGALA